MKINSPTDLVLFVAPAFPDKEIEINAGPYGFKCAAEGLEINPHIKCVDFYGPLEQAGFETEFKTTDAEFGYSFMSTLKVRFPPKKFG